MFKKLVIVVLFITAIGSEVLANNSGLVGDTTIKVKVKGVTCSNDLVTLSDNVKELKGVADCKAGKAGAVSVFNVTYNPALVDRKQIFAAFENTAGCSDPNDRPYKVKN